MCNDSREHNAVPLNAHQKGARKVLRELMAEQVMPKITAVVLDAAKTYAGEIGDDPMFSHNPFAVDEAATAIMRELIEFLWQCEIDIRDAPLVHPKQLSDVYFAIWWSVSSTIR